MKLRTDKQGRLSCRELFPPQSAFEVTRQPDGSIRVIELVEKTAPKARLVRRGGKTFVESSRTITNEDVQREMERFP